MANIITNPDQIVEELNRRFAERTSDAFGGKTYVYQLPAVECVDGFSVSVQASELHYCSPRANFGPYTTVECGFPSTLPAEWADWAETEDTTETVFGRIPLTVVAQTLASHGGLLPAQPAQPRDD